MEKARSWRVGKDARVYPVRAPDSPLRESQTSLVGISVTRQVEHSFTDHMYLYIHIMPNFLNRNVLYKESSASEPRHYIMVPTILALAFSLSLRFNHDTTTSLNMHCLVLLSV